MNFRASPLQPFGILIEPHDPSTHVNDLEIGPLRELFLQQQTLVLRGFQVFQSAQELSDYCEQWGEVSLWPFGKVLELVEQEQPEDHIFDNSYVPLHWDGMYRPHVPEFQIFHCVKAPAPSQGGRTTFSNTLLTLKNASPKLKARWDKVTGVYQRKMEFYESKTVSPLVTRHPQRDFSVIRYNEPPARNQGRFINPPDMEFTGLGNQDVADFHQEIQRALYSPECFYAHQWQDGDVVISDNFSLLHGREGFTSRSPRHLRRVQVLSDPPFENPGLESYK